MDIRQRAKNYIQRRKTLNYPPKILNIEPTNLCNLNCPICVEKKERKQGFLEKELLKKFIQENKKILKGQFIWFHFGGESLLHPELPEMIKILKESDIKVRMSTNAVLLNNEISRKLMESGLDYIVFSVDGVKKETYEKIRKGASFEKVEKNILDFLKIKKDFGLRTKTQIQIVEIEDNKKEIAPFIKKWKKTDINYINVKSFCSRASRVKDKNLFRSLNKTKRKIEKHYPCFYLWETLIILWNGDVLPCCQNLTGELIVGNIKKNSLNEIWNSFAMKELRERHLVNNPPFPCNQCPDWKGFPPNYLSFYIGVLYKLFFKKVLKKDLKDEGITIIQNKL